MVVDPGQHHADADLKQAAPALIGSGDIRSQGIAPDDVRGGTDPGAVRKPTSVADKSGVIDAAAHRRACGQADEGVEIKTPSRPKSHISGPTAMATKLMRLRP